MLLLYLLNLGKVHFTFQIHFVGHQHDQPVVHYVFDLKDQLLYLRFVERQAGVEAYDERVCPLVVALVYGFKVVLSRGVPNLNF